MTNPINPIGPIQQPDDIQKTGKTPKSAKNHPGFKETLAGFMKDVNDMQHKADDSIKKMVSGEVTDVHQVMNSMQQANIAFNMMMEIRNKVLDAYQEIMRMRL